MPMRQRRAVIDSTAEEVNEFDPNAPIDMSAAWLSDFDQWGGEDGGRAVVQSPSVAAPHGDLARAPVPEDVDAEQWRQILAAAPAFSRARAGNVLLPATGRLRSARPVATRCHGGRRLRRRPHFAGGSTTMRGRRFSTHRSRRRRSAIPRGKACWSAARPSAHRRCLPRARES